MYAIKQFKHNFFNPHIEKTCKEEIFREINNLRQLDHQNVAKIVDLVKHQNTPWVVIELCDGNLQNFIEENKGKQIPEDDILEIFAQIIRGLKYVHGVRQIMTTCYASIEQLYE